MLDLYDIKSPYMKRKKHIKVHPYQDEDMVDWHFEVHVA